MTLVLFIFVNLVFFCPKMILCIKIEISRNDFYNSLGFHFQNYKFPYHFCNLHGFLHLFLCSQPLQSVADAVQQADQQVGTDIVFVEGHQVLLPLLLLHQMPAKGFKFGPTAVHFSLFN